MLDSVYNHTMPTPQQSPTLYLLYIYIFLRNANKITEVVSHVIAKSIMDLWDSDKFCSSTYPCI